MIYVQPHAIQRFQERVRQCHADEAKAEILAHAKAIEAAAAFGSHIVKLGDGSRLIIDGGHAITSVVTVMGRHMLPRECRGIA